MQSFEFKAWIHCLENGPVQLKHEIRSGLGIAINDLSQAGSEKAILPSKALFIDLLKSLEIYPVKWSEPPSDNIVNVEAYEADKQAMCRARAVLPGTG